MWNIKHFKTGIGDILAMDCQMLIRYALNVISFILTRYKIFNMSVI